VVAAILLHTDDTGSVAYLTMSLVDVDTDCFALIQRLVENGSDKRSTTNQCLTQISTLQIIIGVLMMTSFS